MKLESLALNKFTPNALKKEQMFQLNGGGIATGSGNVCAPHGPSGAHMNFNNGYDSSRDDGNGGTYMTYHNRTLTQMQWLQPSSKLLINF